MLNLLTLFGLSPTPHAEPAPVAPPVPEPPPAPPKPQASMTAAQWAGLVGIAPSAEVRKRVGQLIAEETGCPGGGEQIYYTVSVASPALARAVGRAQQDVALRRAAANTRRRARRQEATNV